MRIVIERDFMVGRFNRAIENADAALGYALDRAEPGRLISALRMYGNFRLANELADVAGKLGYALPAARLEAKHNFPAQ